MFSAIVFGNDDLSHAVEENCSNFSKKHFIKCIEEKDKYVNDIFDTFYEIRYEFYEKS